MDAAHPVLDDLNTSTKDVEFKALLIFLGQFYSDTQNRSVPENFQNHSPSTASARLTNCKPHANALSMK